MFHEPFVLYGYLAGVAPKLELLTGIVVAPQRQTVLLAKQAAEVDVLTGGRFRLGLGIGWNPIEYEALGMSFTDRARRFEEQIELMRRLWQEPVISFEGRWHRVTAAGINPLPVQRPIPIWIGASAEPALRRAARLGDGWLPLQPIDRDWEATVEKVRSWVREAGRDPVTFGIEAQINVASGTPDDWAARVEMWRKLRATHLALFTMGANLAGPEAHLDRLREAREVLLELL